MTDVYEYSAHDLALYPLTQPAHHESVLQTFLSENYWENGVTEVRVAQVIAESWAVGYGGHYGEVIEEHEEGEILFALAEHLAPKFQLETSKAYDLLCLVRDEWSSRVRSANDHALKVWEADFFFTPALPLGPDHCPACGNKISDQSESGCEAPDGQRWCIAHALDQVARSWKRRNA